MNKKAQIEEYNDLIEGLELSRDTLMNVGKSHREGWKAGINVAIQMIQVKKRRLSLKPVAI